MHLGGKRGRRIDNLINTLINIAIPHYIAGHRAQEFGFQGLNLEVREQIKIKAKGELIPPEDIKEVETGKIFEVRSQTDRTRYYTINVGDNTCSPCPSFPLISFCKHMCAVQNNYPDVTEHQSHRPPSPPLFPADPPTVNPQVAGGATPDSHALDQHLLNCILHKLQHLKKTCVTPSTALTDSLRTLDNSLNAVVGDQLLLPKAKKVASNMGSGWAQTAEAMGSKKVIGATKKGPKKRVHTDPYAGGQASGKQAQPDAREPKRPRLSTPVASTSQAQIPINDTPYSAAEDAGTLSTIPDIDFSLAPEEEGSSGDSRSPEEILFEAIALYNTMFPPPQLDESQPVLPAPRTSYYREHLYR
jgi:hypothetical protein